MENPVEEDYHTSNHYPGDEGQEAEEQAEGTPVAEDPRVISKEFRELEEDGALGTLVGTYFGARLLKEGVTPMRMGGALLTVAGVIVLAVASQG